MRTDKADIVRILVENGADINARNREEKTPIHYAAQTRNWTILFTEMSNFGNFISFSFQVMKTLQKSLLKPESMMKVPQHYFWLLL